MTSDDPLPEVDDESLAAYGKYLANKLSFPFEAKYSFETGGRVICHELNVIQVGPSLRANALPVNAARDAGCEARTVINHEQSTLLGL